MNFCRVQRDKLNSCRGQLESVGSVKDSIEAEFNLLKKTHSQLNKETPYLSKDASNKFNNDLEDIFGFSDKSFNKLVSSYGENLESKESSTIRYTPT